LWSRKGELLSLSGENGLSPIELKITWLTTSSTLTTIRVIFFFVKYKKRTAFPKWGKSQDNLKIIHFDSPLILAMFLFSVEYEERNFLLDSWFSY
jgi:hypothetical protein